MRIIVLSVATEGEPIVQCETPAGPLRVTWRGAVPAPGMIVDVELDAAGELEWGRNVVPVDGTLTPVGSGALVGVVQAIDGELATLRVGDSLIQAVVSGQPPPVVSGLTVLLRPGRWEAWPTGI
jgi:hypothetical protein